MEISTAEKLATRECRSPAGADLIAEITSPCVLPIAWQHGSGFGLSSNKLDKTDKQIAVHIKA